MKPSFKKTLKKKWFVYLNLSSIHDHEPERVSMILRRNSNFVLTLLWMASVQLMAFLSMSVITFTFRCRINKKE